MSIASLFLIRQGGLCPQILSLNQVWYVALGHEPRFPEYEGVHSLDTTNVV